MVSERSCGQCGRVIPWGQVECPFCSEHTTFFWSLGRESFLALVVVFLILLFAFTGFVSSAYHGQERSMAQDWYSRGEAQLRAGRADTAIADFRNALLYSRDNKQYRLQLAEALAAAGRVDEARDHLLSLRESEPGNGTVNLELARLAVRQGMVPEAIQYFHNAIYGEWEKDPIVARRRTRMELSEFLLASGRKPEAVAELFALANDLPPEPAPHARVGALLLEAGDYDHALAQFRQALRFDRSFGPALEGAGEAYFKLGDFQAAQRYLERVGRRANASPRAADLLKTVDMILNIDAFAPSLSTAEKARRTVRAFTQARARLEGCAAARGIPLAAAAGQTPLQGLYARALTAERQTRERMLIRDPDRMTSTWDLIFEIERVCERECGPPQGLDEALILLAGAQGAVRP